MSLIDYSLCMTRIGPKSPHRHYIIEWMDHLGLNQSQVAGRMDTEQATVSKLLTGRQRLSDVWLYGFADAFDIEVADLFRDPNRPTQAELLEGLSEEDTRKVISIIQAFKQAS